MHSHATNFYLPSGRNYDGFIKESYLQGNLDPRNPTESVTPKLLPPPLFVEETEIMFMHLYNFIFQRCKSYHKIHPGQKQGVVWILEILTVNLTTTTLTLRFYCRSIFKSITKVLKSNTKVLQKYYKSITKY